MVVPQTRVTSCFSLPPEAGPVLSLQLSEAGAGGQDSARLGPLPALCCGGTRGSPGAAAPCRALGGQDPCGRDEVKGLPEEPPAEPRQQHRLRRRAGQRLHCVAFAAPAAAVPGPRGTLAATPPSESLDDVCRWFQCRPDGSRSTQLKSSVSVTTVVLSADVTTCTQLLASGQDARFPLLLPHTPRSHMKVARYPGKTWACSTPHAKGFFTRLPCYTPRPP